MNIINELRNHIQPVFENQEAFIVEFFPYRSPNLTEVSEFFMASGRCRVKLVSPDTGSTLEETAVSTHDFINWLETLK